MLTILFNQYLPRHGSLNRPVQHRPRDIKKLQIEKRRKLQERDQKDMLELVSIITHNIL